MKAEEILGVDAVRFIEPSFSALTDRSFNALLADTGGDEGRLLIDERNEPLALAFCSKGGSWIAGSFLCRNPSVELIDLFENVNGEIFQEDRNVWAAAVREYFSRLLVEETTPAVEDLNPVRKKILTQVISNAWGRVSGETCVDCGCGSGVGSLVLRDLGGALLSYDNDAALLARGLAAGRLLPEETMCIDGTVATRYIDPVQKGVGIMMGEINDYTRDLWERIVQELFTVTQETLITVGTEKEATLIQEWGAAMGKTMEVYENPADPLYDRWVCIVRPH
jgi:hypothetical protein